jgi:AcrR family transcriptional regulator
MPDVRATGPDAPPDPSADIDPDTDGSALSRRERERRRRRRAMLRAAQQVFAEKGYAQATLDEIARRAEFGKGTLYNYFEGGKEELLFAVFDAAYDGIYALVERFADDAQERPLREAFRAFVHEAFGFFREHEALFMILMKEAHQFIFGENRKRAAYFHAQEDRLVKALMPLLEQAAEEGEIRALPTRPAAHMMLENTKGVLMTRAMMDHREMRERDCEDTILHRPGEAADMLTAMLFDGLSTDDEAAP